MNNITGQEHNEKVVEEYGDDRIRSFDAKVPTFLKWTYVILPIWGVITLYIFWNGSIGWFDRGSWQQLQIAANTTFPSENHDLTESEQKAEEKKSSEKAKD